MAGAHLEKVALRPRYVEQSYSVHAHLQAFFDRHRCAQAAARHPYGDEIGGVMNIVERLLGQIRVAVADQAEEQVVGVFPGLDETIPSSTTSLIMAASLEEKKKARTQVPAGACRPTCG